MPSFKLGSHNVKVAHPDGDLYVVMIHAKYGWLSDHSAVAVVQARDVTEALRHAAAGYLIMTGEAVAPDDQRMRAALFAERKAPATYHVAPAPKPAVYHAAWCATHNDTDEGMTCTCGLGFSGHKP